MDTIGAYKDRAIQSLSGKWGGAAMLTLVMLVVSVGVVAGFRGLSTLMTVVLYADSMAYIAVPALVQFLSHVLSEMLAWGLMLALLHAMRGGELTIEQLFGPFAKFRRYGCTALLAIVYTILWTLLLIIPGIVKSYSYSMTPYVLRDNPDLTPEQAINRSMELMNGNKMKLFLLDLSFIGWALASLLTLGIGLLWLLPYMYQSHAHFYEDAKAISES